MTALVLQQKKKRRKKASKKGIDCTYTRLTRGK